MAFMIAFYAIMGSQHLYLYLYITKPPVKFLTPSRLRSPHIPIVRHARSPMHGAMSPGAGGRVGSMGINGSSDINPLVGKGVTVSQADHLLRVSNLCNG